MRREKMMSICTLRSLMILLALLVVRVEKASAAERDSFETQFRSFAGEHCVRCHGPDARVREADLRLDDEKDARRLRDGRRTHRRRWRWWSWRRRRVLKLALHRLVDGDASRARERLAAGLAAAGGSAVVEFPAQHQAYGRSVRRRQLTSGTSGRAVANW